MPTEEVFDQSFESILPEEEKSKEEKYLTLGKLKIKLKFVLMGGGGFFGLLILLAVLMANQKPPTVTKPTPVPTSTPTPFEEVITRPSAYATDSAILQIEGQLEVIAEKIGATDIKEVTLNPPALDLKVDFKE